MNHYVKFIQCPDCAGLGFVYDEVQAIKNKVSMKQCRKCCGFGSILRNESYAE